MSCYFTTVGRIFVAMALFFITAQGSAAGAENKVVLADFETAGLGDQFTAVRQIRLSRNALSAPAPDNGPTGSGLSVTTAGKAGVFSKSGAICESLLPASSVEFWIYRSPEAAKAGDDAVEVQFLEQDGKTKFWRKVDLNHSGWQKHTLPLKWFRSGDGRIAQWDRIERWGLWFRDEATLQVDNIALLIGEDEDAALLQREDLLRLAFPHAKAEDVAVQASDDFLLASSAPQLDDDKLAKHLEKVAKRVAAELPELTTSTSPAVLLVFPTRDEYTAFTPRLAAPFGAAAAPPKSQGFTLLGIATSYWDQDQGTLRPVFTHEFVHSAVAHRLGIQNSGEWLQEGLATYYQLQFHPQADLHKLVAEGISDPRFYSPLEQLTSGEAIGINRYWQAATFCDMLARQEKYRDKFPQLLRAFHKAGATDLRPHREQVLAVSWEQLTADWKKWCTEHYAAAK